MEKHEFMELLKEQIRRAESKKAEGNVLDLRGKRFPFKSWDDEWIGSIEDLEDAWNHIKDAKGDWSIDIYENIQGADMAEFTDCAIIGETF